MAPEAHIAAAMGISRKCVRTWIARCAPRARPGWRPVQPPAPPPTDPGRGRGAGRRSCAQRAPGPDWIGAELGVPARTVSRVLARHGEPRLAALDPMTGQVIRAIEDHRGPLRALAARRAGPHGRQEARPDPRRRRLAGARPRRHQRPPDQRHRVGYDYVHSLVDDHSRLAYSEILPDEKGPTCAAFLARAAAYFAAHGIARIERVMTDNAWAYRRSSRDVCAAHALGAQQVHQAALPLAERQGRTPQPHPGHRVGLPAGLHQQRRARRRPCALARALQHSTPPQPLGGTPPISRLAPT